jgi:hypothetical protein
MTRSGTAHPHLPRHRRVKILIVLATAMWSVASAEAPQELTERTFVRHGNQKGVVVLHVNWGRQWGCAGIENAQLQRLGFSRLPLTAESAAGKSEFLLRTPSRLSAKNAGLFYAMLIEPGEYALTEFDVKLAESVSDIGHLRGTVAQLFEGGQPTGGTFTVSAGEMVYIGHFSLDCSQEPIPWRYYIEGRDEYRQYVEDVRKRLPFTGDTPLLFRLFSTTRFGMPYSLSDSGDPSN